MLGDISKTPKTYRPNIYLAKPNKTIISKLTEAYNINVDMNLNGIHEVSFKIPYTVMSYGKKVKNKNAEIIKAHYLLKVDNEWFVISTISRCSHDEIILVDGKLLPYQLRGKTIFNFNDEKNATEAINECLANTSWSVDYVDADFNLTKKSYDIDDKTKLDFLFEIAEAYNAILKFNTNNKSVSLYKLENVGQDKGLIISYGKYLKQIDERPNFDDVCTRLYVYGKNNINISDINPLGTVYIEDFSYYMHPYSEIITDIENDIYEVNVHSKYMSDELCHAILKYNALVNNIKSEFEGYKSQVSNYDSELKQLSSELTELERELWQAKDDLDLWNSRNSGNYSSSKISTVNDAQHDVNEKKSQIENKTNQINSVKENIENLRNTINPQTCFTEELLKERDLFVFERKWSCNNITSTADLYDRGLSEIKKASQPQISYSLSIVDFLKVVECQHDWNKLNLGDIVTVKYPNFDINIKAKIIKISHDIDNNNLNIEIANSKDINRGFYEWIDLIKKSVATSAVLNSNKYKWDEGHSANSKIENYINSKIDAAKQSIVAGVNQNVNIDRQGIKISDPNDTDNYIRILNNILAFTNDGGNTFKHAITPSGIVAENVMGKIILGSKATIGNNDGTIEILGNMITISDLSENERAILGEYEDGKYGLKLKDVTGKTTVLDEDGIMQTWQEGIAENADVDDPVKLYVYLPSETQYIHKCILRFKRERYRAYSKSSSSGGGLSSLETTSSGGSLTTTAKSVKVKATVDNLRTLGDGFFSTSYGGEHSHGGEVSKSALHNHGLESHTHDFTIASHEHLVEIPSHKHNLTLSVSPHSHNLNFGIFEGSRPSNITIKINGINRTTELGGYFNSDQDNLNIAQYMQVGKWNEIELGTSTLGRINATLFIQAKMGV